MLTAEDLKKLDQRYATKQELSEVVGSAVEKLTKVVNDARDYVLTELGPVKEDHDYNRFEHTEFKERLGQIESTPTVAHELKTK